TLVDHMGVTFVDRLTRDAGIAAADAVRLWAIAWAVIDGSRLVAAIDAEHLAADVDCACRLAIEATTDRAAKWVLANTDGSRPAAEVASDLAAALSGLRGRVVGWVAGAEAEAFHRRVSELEIGGVSAAVAQALTNAEWLSGTLDVALIARQLGRRA